MFKRFILLVLFLIVAFYVYRGINPSWAESLIDKIQNKYNSILGRDDVETPIVEDELLTWDLEDLTGDIEIITGEEPGLFDDLDTMTWNTMVTPSLQVEWDTDSDPIFAPTVDTSTPTPTTTTTSTPKPKPSTEVQDTQNLINSLFK